MIPASIRKRYRIDNGAHLVWLDDGETIRVVPVADDPLQSLRGRGRGKKLTERLLSERRKDLDREARP